MHKLKAQEIKKILEEVATELVREKGFIPEFPVDASANDSETPITKRDIVKDLTDLFWISVDNIESQDLDQISFAEKVDNKIYRLYVAIADVDEKIAFDSSIDKIARNNTTSIYTPFKIFPMIPAKFCYHETSLLANQLRNAVVVQIKVAEDGSFELEDLFLAKVKNKQKLAYPYVTNFFDRGLEIPNIIENQQETYQQLNIQYEIAKKIKSFRHKKGALVFEPMQGEAIFENGIPIGIREKKSSSGQELIENIMIAANVCITKFFIHEKLPIIRRIVRTPKRWERIVELAKKSNWKLEKKPDAKSLQAFLMHQQKIDPSSFPDLSLSIIKLIGRGEYILALPGEKAIGHFDLALIDYAHTTAPNRRYPDLTVQRILINHLFNKDSLISEDILYKIAANCSAKEEAASKIERHLFKSFAAFILSSQLGYEFSAIVTGSTNVGTWVRLLDIPVEGKLIKGYEHVDVGDHLQVKLCHVDIIKGFIDFCKK